ncbi:MAG: hypothetical protein Q7W56_11630 [Candidatus Latescibacteria bacterium]|nr:hypothetical protein [Candidatus Latescibacterota bacterium]
MSDHGRPNHSRFAENSDAFPLRQALRCRDELIQTVIKTALSAVLACLLVSFGLSAHRLFDHHRAKAGVWGEVLLLGVVGFVLLLTVRGVVLNLLSFKGLIGEWRLWSARARTGWDGS